MEIVLTHNPTFCRCGAELVPVDGKRAVRRCAKCVEVEHATAPQPWKHHLEGRRKRRRKLLGRAHLRFLRAIQKRGLW